MTNTKKKIFFTFITFCLIIASLELILTVASLISPRVKQLVTLKVSNTIPDEKLGHRPNPEIIGHDRKGFRNLSVPGRAKIVALGDSQTYGAGVGLQDAWPIQLGRLIDNSVYSMAYGGYGPAHSLILWKEASELNPDIYIEAFYSGNDLFDSFNLIYNKTKHDDLMTTDKGLREKIRDMEESESIIARASKMRRRGKDDTKGTRRIAASVRNFLNDYSKLYVFKRQVKHQFFRNKKSEDKNEWQSTKNDAEKHPNYNDIFDDDKFKTIFTPAYRYAALDLNDIRIVEGLRISLQSINRMNRLTKQKQKIFITILIPTKELVFKELVKNPSAKYLNLIKSEEQMWEETKAYFRDNNIEYLDTLPSLREVFSQGFQPYKTSNDGHPNEYGHKAIAEFVYQRVMEENSESPHASK